LEDDQRRCRSWRVGFAGLAGRVPCGDREEGSGHWGGGDVGLDMWCSMVCVLELSDMYEMPG
jgi:hypothetical protein